MTPLEFIQQACFFAERRGYKSSWPYVVFRERYGTWPGALLKEGEPQPPTEEFIDWVLAYWRLARPPAPKL